MRDVQLSEIADRIQQQLQEQHNIKLPRTLVLTIARKWVHILKKVIATDNDRLTMRESDILCAFTPLDMQKLCEDLAEGKDVVTYNTFRRKSRLTPRIRHYALNPDFRRL